MKPILRGRDIKRYAYKWAGLWIIIIPAGWTNTSRGTKKPQVFIEETFPLLMRYLKQFKDKAKQRDDQGDYWWELRPCVYYSEFEKEKIVWQELAQGPQFALDEEGKYFVLNTAYILTGPNLRYILGYLNSKVNEYSYKKWYCTLLGEEGTRWLHQHVINIPLPPITPDNQALVNQIETLVDQILAIKKNNPDADTSRLEEEIDKIVYKLYDLTDEEIAIIEEDVMKESKMSLNNKSRKSKEGSSEN